MNLVRRLIQPSSWSYMEPDRPGIKTVTAMVLIFGYPIVGTLCYGAFRPYPRYHAPLTILCTLLLLVGLYWGVEGRSPKSFWDDLAQGSFRAVCVNALIYFAAAIMVMPLVGAVNLGLGNLFGYSTGPKLQPFAFAPMLTSHTPWQVLVAWVGTALLPPITEELLVRGAWMAWLRRFGWGVALGGSSLYFAILHVSPGLYLPTATLGFFFALASIRARHIGAGILAHVLWNSSALVIGLLRAH